MIRRCSAGRWRACTASPTGSCGPIPARGARATGHLAGGMAAALPYLDEFVAGHSLAALEQLATALARPSRRGGPGRLVNRTGAVPQ